MQNNEEQSPCDCINHPFQVCDICHQPSPKPQKSECACHCICNEDKYSRGQTLDAQCVHCQPSQKEGEVKPRLNEKGQCPFCLKKPLIYKRIGKYFCCRCNRDFDLKTGTFKENFAWDQDNKCKHAGRPKESKCPTCGKWDNEERISRLYPPEPEKENEILEGWRDQIVAILWRTHSIKYAGATNDLLDNIDDLLTAQAARSFIDGVDSIKEIVICAAVIADNGKIFRGHRHSDCLNTMRGCKLKYTFNAENQGFITSKNRYVNRKEAQKLQKAAGIPSADRDGYQGNELYSEDLY